MKRPTYFRLLLPVLAGIVAACLVAIALLVVIFQPEPKGLAVDLIRAFTQIGIVAVAGAIINVLLKDREAMQARTAALHAFQTDVLERLSRASIGTKRQRRHLRAHAFTSPWRGGAPGDIRIVRAPYVEAMKGISEAELELEDLRHEIDVLPADFPEREKILGNVNRMREYVRKLLRQYERTFPAAHQGDTFDLGPFTMPDGDNPTLADFVGPKEGSTFEVEFEDQFRTAARLLREAVARTR